MPRDPNSTPVPPAAPAKSTTREPKTPPAPKLPVSDAVANMAARRGPRTESADDADGTASKAPAKTQPKAKGRDIGTVTRAKIEPVNIDPPEPEEDETPEAEDVEEQDKAPEDDAGDADETAEPADEAAEGDEADGEDAKAEKPAPRISDADYEELMGRFRAPAAAPVEPKAVAKGEADAPADYLKNIDAALTQAEEEFPGVSATLKPLAEAVKALSAEIRGTKAETSKAQADREAAEYERNVHAMFDAESRQGKRDLYGDFSTGRMTDEQLRLRRTVHDVADSMYGRLKGTKFKDRTFTPRDAVALAEETVLRHMGINPAKKADKAAKDREALETRHNHRSAQPRSTAIETGEPDDPNDADGTAPPRRARTR